MTVTTSFLTGISLIGSSTPALASDGQPADVGRYTYEQDREVLAAMAKWAPVNSSETVMGYPKGLERDKEGSVKAVTLEDVRDKLNPVEAIVQARNAARQYAQDAKNPAALRYSARHLSDGWPNSTPPSGYEIRRNTKDDALPSAPEMTAEQYCGMVNTNPNHWAYGQTAPCVFVGTLDEKYPVRGVSDGVTGESKLTYKVSATVWNEESVTKGWSAGGKITPKIGDGSAGGEISGEASFTYSYAVTSATKLVNTQETAVEVNVPQGKKGYLEGRANGAYYTGYIVLRDIDTNQKEHMVAIPARAYVQAPTSSSAVTWFKRLTSS
ncbi:hypothetical protein [Streptomyces lavendulocolor]|uniref:hypothetical protein n=1 Tax=Streptomyces lavendulocolor TaxID=67316 RepID=UPI0033E5B59B